MYGYSRFPHRQNSDGTYDSICIVCFATVGSAESEDELLLLERSHACNARALLRRERSLDEWRSAARISPSPWPRGR
jgi:hypothetical protein